MRVQLKNGRIKEMPARFADILVRLGRGTIIADHDEIDISHDKTLTSNIENDDGKDAVIKSGDKDEAEIVNDHGHENVEKTVESQQNSTELAEKQETITGKEQKSEDDANSTKGKTSRRRGKNSGQ